MDTAKEDCGCGGRKPHPNGGEGIEFSKASILLNDDPVLLEETATGLLPAVPAPVVMDIYMDDGKKRTITLRRNETIARHLKVRAMHRVPHLFFPDDPDWQYVPADERVSELFQAVKV